MFKVIPDAVSGQTVRFLARSDSARQAAQMMRQYDISAVVVIEDDVLLGVVTERDLARRVVGGGLDADATALEGVMTPEPETIAPDDSTLEALE